MKRVLIFYLFFASTLAMANTTLQSCLGIKEDTLRLKCYDDIAYKVNQVTTELEEITISNTKEESKNDLGILERTFGLPKNKQKKKTDAKNINITSTITKLLQNNNYKIDKEFHQTIDFPIKIKKPTPSKFNLIISRGTF